MNSKFYKGVYHNLLELFEKLNRQYFNERIVATIRWGQRQKASRKSSIVLGHYSDEKKRIVIHPSLDQAMVPTLCVERIIHHEMLHQVFPIRIVRGRRQIHTREFKIAEAEFKGAKMVDKWLKANLDRILRF